MSMKKSTKSNAKVSAKGNLERRRIMTAMRNFIALKSKKAVMEEQQRKAKAILEQFAKENRVLFDEDGNFKLKGGYLHFGKQTIVKPCEGFDMGEFVKEFPELVDQVFKTGMVKSMLSSEEGKEKLLQNHCVELAEKESFDIVVKS